MSQKAPVIFERKWCPPFEFRVGGNFGRRQGENRNGLVADLF